MRQPSAAPVECTGCGSSFRAEYTEGRCPICDRPVEGSARPVGRIRGALGDRWVPFLLVAALVGNLVIFVLVAIAASR